MTSDAQPGQEHGRAVIAIYAGVKLRSNSRLELRRGRMNMTLRPALTGGPMAVVANSHMRLRDVFGVAN